MNLLVTGGCGFIGSAFIRYVLRHTAKTRVMKLVNLDALTYAGNRANVAEVEKSPRYTFAYGDIGDHALVTRLLAQHAIDAVVHFAAESHVDHSIHSPEPFYQTNVLGTLRLMNCARLYWQDLPADRKAEFRFIHISTDEVFGSLGPNDAPFTEQTRFAPNSPYAASKAASDYIARCYYQTFGFPVIVTNCSNNYGPHQFPEKLIPRIITEALKGNPLTVHGDGQQVRDWIHVNDHCEAIMRVLAAGHPGESYNIGGNWEATNRVVIGSICDLLDQMHPRSDGASYASQVVHVADRPGNDRRYSMDCAKMLRELWWSPKIRFADGLSDPVHFYLGKHLAEAHP